MIETGTMEFIDKVGVAAAAFVMMFALYVQNQKWSQKQQEKSEERYTNLMTTFIETVKSISTQQVAALEKLATKLDEHTRSKEEFMDLIKDGRRTT